MNKLIKFLKITGLTWFVPLARICAGDNPQQQMRQLWLMMGVPIVAFFIFLGLWSVSAQQIKTSLGAIPGPVAVWSEAGGLVDDHQAERKKELAFYERQRVRNEKKLIKDPDAKVKIRPYPGKPTYLDQIITSLYTPESVTLTSTVESYNNTVSFQDYPRFLNDELFKLTDIARFLFANNSLLALNVVHPAKLSLGSHFPFFYRVV